MKTLRVVLVAMACSSAIACGSSSTATTTGDVATTGDDTAADAVAGDTLADTDAAGGGDALSGETIGDDAGLTDTPTAKYPTCAAITDCAQAACANSTDSSCASACLADGAPSALPAATALLTCIQTKCITGECKNSTDPKCLGNCSSIRCMPDVFACIEDGKTGTGACGDIKTCFDNCNAKYTNVMSCMQTCYEAISADGKSKGKAFGTCTSKAPAGADPTAQCMKETIGCFVDGKSGTKSCTDSIACLAKCDSEPDGFGCAIGVFSEMSKAAQDAYVDAAPCFGQDVTATAGCVDKVVVCLAPSGTETCGDALSCVMGCNGNGSGDNNPSCTFNCLHNTTPDSAKLLIAKLGCNPSDATCAASLVQCIAPTGDATCPAVMSCASGCGGGPGQPPDMKCVLGCVKKGSNASATSAFSAMSCQNNQNASCTDTLVSCYNPSGTDNCAQLTQCVQGCYSAGGDVAGCQATCYGSASVQAFKDFLALTACQQGCSKTCNNDQTCTQTCTEKQCKSAQSACQPT